MTALKATALFLSMLLFTGCAASYTAFVNTPKRINDAVIKDPVRRVHVLSRIVEALVGGGITSGIIAGAGAPFTAPAILLGVLGEFIYYEYLAEPAGWTGHYWERGPADGEEFLYE